MLGKQRLANTIVYLVRTRMIQVLSFQLDLRATRLLGEPVGVI